MEAQVSKSVETAPIQPYSVFIEHESIGMMMMSGTRYSTRDFQLVDHHVCQGTVLAQEGKKVQIAYDDGEREWLSLKKHDVKVEERIVWCRCVSGSGLAQALLAD